MQVNFKTQERTLRPGAYFFRDALKLFTTHQRPADPSTFEPPGTARMK
jgi:hypothetical protein